MWEWENGRIYIWVQINSTPIKALIDTGIVGNIIDAKLAERIRGFAVIFDNPQPEVLKTDGGIRILRRTFVTDVRINNIIAVTGLAVLENALYPLRLGTQFLQHLGAEMKLEKETLKLGTQPRVYDFGTTTSTDITEPAEQIRSIITNFKNLFL